MKKYSALRTTLFIVYASSAIATPQKEAPSVDHIQDPVEKILYAAKVGNVHAVKQCLEEGTSANSSDAEGNSPLHLAAEYGHNDVIQQILEDQNDIWFAWLRGKQIDINQQNKKGNTALHCAAYNGHGDTVLLMLEKTNADINIKNNQRLTPLDLAIQQGHLSLVSLLLYNNAYYNVKNGALTPLHIAIEQGHQQLINKFIQDSRLINIKDRSGLAPLHLAVQKESIELTDLLLTHHADINIMNNQGQTPLLYAIESGNFTQMRFLEQHGANVDLHDYHKKAPIHIAVQNGRNDMLTYLLARSIMLDAQDSDGNSALNIAAQKNNVHAFDLLIAQGADIYSHNNHNQSPFSYAVRNTELFERIKHHPRFNINARNNNAQTQLMIAAYDGDVATAERLLINGAQLDIQDRKGEHALHKAVKHSNNKAMMELIIANSSLINTVDYNKNSPLLTALHNKKEKNATVLIELGASVSQANNEGETPLHKSVYNDDIFNTKLLLTKGAKNCVDRKGFTPLHYAATLRDGNEFISALLAHHANPIEKDPYGNNALHIAIRNKAFLSASIILNATHKHHRSAIINAQNNQGETPIFLCINKQATQLVRTMMHYAPDYTIVDNKGNTYLHEAARVDSNDLVFLFTLPELINAKNKAGETPLIIAAKHKKNSIAIVKTLLSQGAKINLSDENGLTAVAHATHNNSLDSIKMLHEYGASLLKTDNNGDSLTHIAAQCGNMHILEYLDNNNALFMATNKKQETPFMLSIKHNKLSVIDFFVARFNPSQRDIKGLIQYAKNTYAYTAEERLEQLWKHKEKLCLQIIEVNKKIVQATKDNIEWYEFLMRNKSSIKNYVPCQQTNYTYDHLASLRKDQLLTIIDKLSSDLKNETNYTTYLQSKWEEIKATQQGLMTECERILQVQSTIITIQKQNKASLEDIKKLATDNNTIPSYVPTSCCINYNLEKLMVMNSNQRNNILADLLQCQAHETHNQTKLEQVLKDILEKNKHTQTSSNNSTPADDEKSCFICGDNPEQLQSMPCHCKTLHACQECFNQYIAQYPDKCPTCHGKMKS